MNFRFWEEPTRVRLGVNRRKRIQGSRAYTSPEAIFKKNINGCKFFSCEVYPLGLVLHELFYEKNSALAKFKIREKTSSSESPRFHELSRKIKRFTKSKKWYLAKKTAKETITAFIDFEFFTLRMGDPDPPKRGRAAERVQQVQQILSHV